MRNKTGVIWYCAPGDLRSARSLARRYITDRDVRFETRENKFESQKDKLSLVSFPDLTAQIAGVGAAALGTFRGSYYHPQRTLIVDYPWSTFKTPLSSWTMRQDLAKIKVLGQEGYQPEEMNWQEGPINLQFRTEATTIDIETTEWNTLSIVGLGCIHRDGTLRTTVLNMHKRDDVDFLHQVLKSNIPKITHNGKFDFYHLLRHGFSPRNWKWDTEYAWNAWRAEQKKSLAYVASVTLPDYQYWKQTASSDLVLYNAKDCWYTARIALEQLRNMPDWAMRQCQKKMSRVVPALACEIQGLNVNEPELEFAKVNADIEVLALHTSLGVLAGTEFNPNSPAQVKKVLQDIGLKPKGTAYEELLRLTQLKGITKQQKEFLSTLIEYREEHKALSTYYNAPLLDGKLLYSLKVDGTETDRGASSKSSLYVPRKAKSEKKRNYGAQLQNIPKYYRKVLRGPDGWKLINIDIKQGDAYGAAYMAGDLQMIKDLEDTPELSNGIKDFYCYVASKNFNLVIDKKHPLRQLQKKICHASVYLMGVKTFIQSCATEISPTFLGDVIDEFFPGESKTQFADRVIKQYIATYPNIVCWWRRTQQALRIHRSIVTPDGWVREFCGDLDSHDVLRAAVAHQPQHMTVVPIWDTFVWAYYELQMGNQDKFRLIGQVHDSLMAIAREDWAEYYQRRLLEKLENFAWETTGGTLKYRYDPEIKTYWEE